MSGESITNMSPPSNDLEKSDLEKETHHREDEEIEQADENDQDAMSVEDRSHIRVPLQQIQSHSSTRSRKSYTDGYTHYEEEDLQGTDQAESNSQRHDKEFEVKFEGQDDPMNPKCKPTWRKWTIVLIGSFCSLVVTCASALYTSTYSQMEEEYGISKEVATVGLTTYVCGLGLGPMILGPLSEFYGEQSVGYRSKRDTC